MVTPQNPIDRIDCARCSADIDPQLAERSMPVLMNAAPLVTLATVFAVPMVQAAVEVSLPSVLAMRAKAASLAKAPMPAVLAASASHSPRAVPSWIGSIDWP